MFEKLMALAKQGDFTMAVRVSGTNADELTVIVAPMPKEGQDPALGHPIRLTGTPEDLEQNFGAAMDRFVGARGTLLEQLEATETVLKQATTAAANKASDALKGKQQPAKTVASTTSKPEAKTTSASAATSDGASDFDDDDFGGDGAGPATVATAQPAAGSAAVGNLFG